MEEMDPDVRRTEKVLKKVERRERRKRDRAKEEREGDQDLGEVVGEGEVFEISRSWT